MEKVIGADQHMSNGQVLRGRCLVLHSSGQAFGYGYGANPTVRSFGKLLECGGWGWHEEEMAAARSRGPSRSFQSSACAANWSYDVGCARTEIATAESNNNNKTIFFRIVERSPAVQTFRPIFGPSPTRRPLAASSKPTVDKDVSAADWTTS